MAPKKKAAAKKAPAKKQGTAKKSGSVRMIADGTAPAAGDGFPTKQPQGDEQVVSNTGTTVVGAAEPLQQIEPDETPRYGDK